MIVADLGAAGVRDRLAGPGLAIAIGPFVVRLATRLPEIAPAIHLLYGDYPIDEGGIADFHVRLIRSPGIRARLAGLVEFRRDDMLVYIPYPRSAAVPLVEWGLNFCIYSSRHEYLILHAAVVERGGRALILPGKPGAGKSTLCAALVAAGWRLMSDEFALVRPADGLVVAVPRPISLKNESIALARTIVPDLVMGPIAEATQKGRVAHLKPPADSVARAAEPARPAWVVFPSFTAGAERRIEPLPRARAHFSLAENSFNYHVLGETGFEAQARLIETCTAWRLSYGTLDQALSFFDDLATRAAA